MVGYKDVKKMMSKNQAFQVLVMTPTHRSFGRSYFSLKLRFKLVSGVNILIRLSSSSLLAILLSSHPSQTQTVRVGGKYRFTKNALNM